MANIEWAKDNQDTRVPKDLNGGFPYKAYEIIYGKFGFNEWIADITEERLVELLTTGKPVTLGLYPEKIMKGLGRLQPGYDTQ